MAGYNGKMGRGGGRRPLGADSAGESDHRKSVEQSSLEGDHALYDMYGGRGGGGGRVPVPGKDFIMDDKDVDPTLLAKWRTTTAGRSGGPDGQRAHFGVGVGPGGEDLETNEDASSTTMMKMLRHTQ